MGKHSGYRSPKEALNLGVKIRESFLEEEVISELTPEE